MFKTLLPVMLLMTSCNASRHATRSTYLETRDSVHVAEHIISSAQLDITRQLKLDSPTIVILEPGGRPRAMITGRRLETITVETRSDSITHNIETTTRAAMQSNLHSVNDMQAKPGTTPAIWLVVAAITVLILMAKLRL